MSETDMTQNPQTNDGAGTGDNTGSVAGSQGQEQVPQSTQDSAQNQGGQQDQRVEEAFAKRLAHEKEKINERIRGLFGYSLDELEQAMQGQTQTAQPTPQYGAQATETNIQEINERLLEALYQNPAGVIQALAQSIQTSVQQQMAPVYATYNKQRVAERYGERFQKVAPVVDEILRRRPDLAMSEQGVELAFVTAVGLMADQLTADAAAQAATQSTQLNQQMVHGDARSGEVSTQGGGQAKTPEQALVDMILNASA